jgi:hypothetical protein
MLIPIFVIVGCLLRSLPTDISFDNTTGISFTCDLSDNIAAPWPSSSSVQSLSLCAPGKEQLISYLGHRNSNTFQNRCMIFPNTLLIHVHSHIGVLFWFQKCRCLHCLSHQHLEAQVHYLHSLPSQFTVFSPLSAN